MPEQTATTIRGRLTLTAKGFGFVDPSSGPSVLIPFDHVGRALSGDTVTAEVFPDSAADKPAGRVIEVLERSSTPIVGRVSVKGSSVRLYPQANRSPKAMDLDPRSLAKAGIDRPANGDVVEAEFVEWTDAQTHPVGRAVALIAGKADPELELRLIATSRGIPLVFPERIEAAAAKITMPPDRALGKDRRDLRDLVCFTIDPDTAKDFDDAVSVRQVDSGMFELGVHIADVSYFVQPGDAVDEEAWSRGTSVYLVDTVLPMLPETLSNGLCSLVPDEDRLAMTVLATVDSSGTVHGVEITPSVIRSKRRYTYSEAEAVLSGEKDGFARQIQLLHLVTQVLKQRRTEAGSVDLDLTRPQIRTDDDGVPVAIRPTQRRRSNRMIEECMLLANRLVAEHLQAYERLSSIYRVHPTPRESDLARLVDTLRDLGVPYRPGNEAGPDDYRRILSFIENFEFRDLVETLAMKSLQKAVYATQNDGHFGLAMDAYTHFTSPIRRYPDVVIHRLLTETLRSGRRRRRGGAWMKPAALDETCAHANERERLATSAEREYTRLKALEFLETRVGREYAGVVSGVASIGIFVEIERYLIEGLVHISKLGSERFSFDRAAYRLTGDKTGKTFSLGDEVRVRVESVNTRERTADFVLL